MALIKDSPRDYQLGEFEDYPVDGGMVIYEGAAVVVDGGYAAPLAVENGGAFVGFASQQADNALGQAGDVRVRVKVSGLVKLNVDDLIDENIGADVYATDDDSFTLLAGNIHIGHVQQFVEDGVGIVAFCANKSVEMSLTDDSGGTASDTIAVIGATYAQAEVANAIASLAAKINYLLGRKGG